MPASLENLHWAPRWVSHLGCVKGCLDYLGLEVFDAWLYGATGHAFLLNIHDIVCPSGPTAWRSEVLHELGRHLGYVTDGVWSDTRQPDFAAQQERGWALIRHALDQGLPCYGWELDVPEFYVIHGYDATGYYFRGPGCDAGRGPKPWRTVGDSAIGALVLLSIAKGTPSSDRETVRAALDFVLDFADTPSRWTIGPQYHTGLAGYDQWITALEAGTAHALGMAYNAEVWSECRAKTVPFLVETGHRLNGVFGPLCDEAARHYAVVAEHLAQVAALFPFFGSREENLADAMRRDQGIHHLRHARDAEANGLEALRMLRGALRE